jgi:hypothetical protein
VFTLVPFTKVREIAKMLKAIHAQEDLSAARNKAQVVEKKLRTMKLAKGLSTNLTQAQSTYQGGTPSRQKNLCLSAVYVKALEVQNRG